MANWPAIGSVILPNVGGWANGLYFAGQIKRDDKVGTETFLIIADWPAIGSVILPNVGGWANGLYFAGQIKRDDKVGTETCLINADSPAIRSVRHNGGWANGIYFARQIKRDEKEKSWYDDLKKPSWNPPKWVFGPAWTALYSGMGYASYLVLEECDGFTESAVVPMTLYGTQLLLNWAWTPIFFGLKDFKLAFIEIAVLSGAATATTISFASFNKTAGALMVPYLAWLAYASSLSYYIWQNNPKVTEVKGDKDK